MATAGITRPTTLRLGLAVALMLLSRVLLPVGAEPAQPALVAMIYACAAMFALVILRPQSDLSFAGLLGWCATMTALCAGAIIIDPVTRPVLAFLPGLAVTLLLLSVTLVVLTRRVPVALATVIVAFITLMPIWAAPAVELAGNPTGLTNAVVHLSPLSAFAVALDLDYLRSNWFYANVVLGSMRYSYPAWLTFCLMYSVFPVAALLLRFARSTAIPSVRFTKEARL